MYKGPILDMLLPLYLVIALLSMQSEGVRLHLHRRIGGKVATAAPRISADSSIEYDALSSESNIRRRPESCM